MTKTYTPEELAALEKANIPDAGISAAKWKAVQLNKLFAATSRGGSQPNITPEIVRHGEQAK